MGFLDSAQDVFDRGVSVAKGAVSTVAGEQLGFVKGFCRMCDDGYRLGYHEANGGNASYRLTTPDVEAARSFFYDHPSSWVPFSASVPEMAGEFLLVTGSGKHLRNAVSDPVVTTGIVEVNLTGDSWRIVWGLKDGGRPTSEIAAHAAAHAVRKAVTRGASRVLYHAHPASLCALTTMVPPDPRTITRVLWSMFTESVVAFPDGLGYVGWKVPGSLDLARATAEQLKEHAGCVWQLHGMFSSGATFDEALGRVQAADKAAEIYLQARAAQGGNPNVPYTVTDADVRAIASAYNLALNETFLS